MDQLVVGQVYGDLFSPKRKPEPKLASKVLKRAPEPVILRNLESKLKLVGRYVAVEDGVNAFYWNSMGSRNLRVNTSCLMDSSWIDRMMAYYHVDLIPRFFRDLGLDTLDEYPHLNPLYVVLDAKSKRTYYGADDQRIHRRRLAEGHKIRETR